MLQSAKKHKREHVVIVAEVSGDSVGIAFVSMAEGKPGTVMVAERTPLTFEDRTEAATIANIVSQIAIVGERAQKSYTTRFSRRAKPVSEIYVVLHAPWARSRVARTSVKFPEETLITDSVIADLAKRMLDTEKDVRANSLFEAGVVRTELNGYPCGRPTRKRAGQLALSAIISVADVNVRSQIEHAFQKLFPHVIPIFRSATRVAISVLNRTTQKPKEYFVMHIADEATSFTVVRDGVVTESQSVAEGTRSIVKRVAGSGMPEAALSMMRMLAREQCSDPACETIRDAMGKAEPDLVRAFGEAMNKCVAERRMPNTLILVAHPDLLPWLAKFFVRIDFTQFTLTTQPFEVQSIHAKDVEEFVRPTEGVVLDTSLALCCALVHIESVHS